MTRAAVLIGVAKTGGLPQLSDAVGGAERMKSWAMQHGFAAEDLHLITDKDGPVKIAAIQQTIHALVDSGTVEQLIVYFAGHGVNIGLSEYWLLSGAPVDDTAAINLEASAALARRAGIPHVVFISDACRTPASTIQAQGIRGSALFPNDPVSGPEQEVDIFFAATLGRPALELGETPFSKTEYRAIYTDAFLDGVSGKLPTALAPEAQDVLVVRPRRLKACLSSEIPRRFAEKGFVGTIPPIPDARITSGDQAWLARFTGAHPPPLGAPVPEAPGTGAPDVLNVDVHELLRRVQHTYTTRRGRTRGPEKHGDLPFPDVFDDRRGWRNFTDAVIGVEGARIIDCLPRTARIDSAGQRIVVAMEEQVRSVLLVLADGSSFVLPVIRGHTIRVRVMDGELMDLMYLPWGDQARPDWTRRARLLTLAHGKVALAAQTGTLTLEEDTVQRIIAQMGEPDGADPALALYAAYALHRQYLREPLRELHRLLYAQYGFSFFDIALLAVVDEMPSPDSLPQFPLMSQGWPLLQIHGNTVPDFLVELQRHLMPSMWSQFSPEGTALLYPHFSKGE